MSEERKGLRDDSGRPLRLFQVDGRPATARNGEPLLNICGNPLVSFQLRKSGTYYCDLKSSLLLDSKGRTQEDPGFAPWEAPLEVEQKRFCQGIVYALDGHPLTDENGVPLTDRIGRPLVVFNPKGHPVTDLEGRDITDATGLVLNPLERPYLSKDKLPLRIFDEIGRPLTDEHGFPFTDILGFPLIANDEFRNPLQTKNGFPLRDADGLLPWNEGYDLTKTPKYNVIHKAILCKNKEIGIAFDRFGHPLTDMYGFPLFDNTGIPLVKKIKKMWLDTHKDRAIIIEKSIFDKDGLKYLNNSKNSPVRLYDRRGYPLTDHEGMPQINAQGILLIRFDESGEPVTDSWGYPVYDCRGNPFGSIAFKPCKDFEDNPIKNKLSCYKKIGAQYYDIHGMPLTNIDGVPLVSAHQDLMVDFDCSYIPQLDIHERGVFDILGLPVGCTFDKNLKGPTGEPIRLYNKFGKPLTDKDGKVLTSVSDGHLLRMNHFGRIVSDSKGYPFYDADGCPMTLTNRFLPTKSPANEVWTKALRNLDGSALVTYDLTGEPLTDLQGRILLDNTGTPLIVISAQGFIQEKNGEFLLDSDGYTNFKIAGHTLKDKMAIYDKHDRPLIGPSGYILRLRTGKEVVKFDNFGFPSSTIEDEELYDSQGKPIFTPMSDMYNLPVFNKILVYNGELQLFDCEDRPLLDITGELLFTSKGVPLVNLCPDGSVRSDALGRPVFDQRGIPICNPGGVWRDQKGLPYRLYDGEGYPVTDARGKELLDITGRPLLGRDKFGHPMYDLHRNVDLTDAEGRRLTAEGFNGTWSPAQRRCSSLMEGKEVPLSLYDSTGRPLTDDCGKPLENSKGKPILDLTKGINRITDMNGRSVYDSRRLPLGCSDAKPILSAKGEPIVLYNKDGNPLMTREGVPIKRVDGTTLLDFDQFGRPVYADGSGLYDVKKRLESFQSKVMRLVLRAPWFVRNTQIGRELGVDSLEEHLRQLVQGHVERLTSIEVAAVHNLGVRTPARRLKPRLYQDSL